MTGPRYCLWGGREDWVQVGSSTDRRLQAMARMTANVERLGLALARAMLPAIERAGEALREFAAAIERSRIW